jgi:predicted esterase
MRYLLNLHFLLLLPLLLLTGQTAFAQARLKTIQVKEQFKERSPEGQLKAQAERLGWSEATLAAKGADYEIEKESFQVFAPKAALKSSKPWGLIVWVAPSLDGYVPPFWEPGLSRHKLLGVGANDSGNHRTTTARIGLALDAVFNMKARYKIDPERIYIAGFSGGGVVASYLAWAWPDVFRGGLYVGGCNYIHDVPVPGERKLWRGDIKEPSALLLGMARERSRHVYICGEKDPALSMMKTVSAQAEAEGAWGVQFYEVPKLDHSVPDGAWIDRIVKALDKKPAKKEGSEKGD